MVLNYSFTSEDYNQATKFAKDKLPTVISSYKGRNRSINFEGILNTSKVGALGEIAAYNILHQYIDISKPDFAIYKPKDKNWEPDLASLTKKPAFGVKAQTEEMANRCKLSWIYQFGDGKKWGCDRPFFVEKSPNYYSVLILLKDGCGELKAVVSADDLYKYKLFQPTVYSHIRDNKVAVYFADLQKHGLADPASVINTIRQ
jgi:hypothetical protein